MSMTLSDLVEPTDTTWLFPEGAAAYPSLEGHGWIAIDLETYDPDLKTKGPGTYRDGFIAGVAVGTSKGFRQYYPLRHEGHQNCHVEGTLKWLAEQMKLPQPKVGANLQYDLEYLKREGLDVVGPFYDVQVAESLLDENRFSYSLETLAKDYLGEGKVQDEMEKWLVWKYGPRNPKSNIWRAPPHIVGPYAESDVDLPLRIFREQRDELVKQGLWDLFLVECKLIPLLMDMRARGVRVDIDAAERADRELKKEYDDLLGQIRRDTGASIDVWAADSLAPAYDALGIEYPLTAKSRRPSFTKKWLQNDKSDLSKTIVRCRELDKTRGTFIQGYILDGHVNGRIHGQFHQAKSDDGGTVTGRFSSSNPNLQNIPSRGEAGKLVRSIFIPEEDQLWWARDWSQVEYRLMVQFAEQQKYPGAAEVIDSFIENPSTDFHQFVADLTHLDRSAAKGVNFGIIYGLGKESLATNLGGDMAFAEEVLRKYHERMPFVKPLMEKARRISGRVGEVRTLLGRRRRFYQWEDRNGKLLSETGRTAPQPGARRAHTNAALNAKIQGSAADIMKKAMVDILESGAFDVIGVPHLTVHDELDGSYDPSKAEHREALETVHHIMENCVADRIRIPLKADGTEGNNWAEAK